MPDTECALDGRCDWDATRCVQSAASCAASIAREGKRVLTSDGQCRWVAQSDTTCREKPEFASSLCEFSGDCHAKGGFCVPQSDSDCRKAWICRSTGRCHFDPTLNACVARVQADCKRSELCQLQSRCILEDGRCTVGADVDCRQSEACARAGRCHRLGPRCVIQSPVDCAKSQVCRDFGQCSFEDGYCVAKTRADCAGSLYCQTRGWCKTDGTSCVADPAICGTKERCVPGAKRPTPAVESSGTRSGPRSPDP